MRELGLKRVSVFLPSLSLQVPLISVAILRENITVVTQVKRSKGHSLAQGPSRVCAHAECCAHAQAIAVD